MVIGGMFELEKAAGRLTEERPNTIYTMSGRCAIYACLKDMGSSKKKIAYVPAYTCETVLASYQKAGYSLRFYDIDPDGLKPLFKEDDLEGVGIMNLCGYYGFLTYDDTFIDICHKKGITILHDTTHSPTYPDPKADYAAGSLRKWMGIASGGIATKSSGAFTFPLLPVDEEHMKGRYKAMEERSKAIETGDDSYNAKASETFWDTELRLREIFDAYSSDEYSVDIILHFNFKAMEKKRRSNFKTVISNLSKPRGWRPIYMSLKDNDVPSHFSLFADNRDDLQRFLRERKIASTVYWPIPPMIDDISRYKGASYIYDHICSIQLDQRYGKKEMEYLANSLNAYSDKH